MACKAICAWTFRGLVGAFLDITIAYSLLCASAFAYFSSKFLGLFGMCLPCPCNGLFGNPSKKKCWQGKLVVCPCDKISRVQFSVMNKFPFESVWSHDELDCESSSKSTKRRQLAKSEGEVYSSSLNETGSGIFGVDSVGVKERGFDFKLKEAGNKRSRYGLRCRRRTAGQRESVSTAASCVPLHFAVPTLPQSPGSGNNTVNGDTDSSTFPDSHRDGRLVSEKSTLPENVSLNGERDEPGDKDISSAGLASTMPPDVEFDSNKETTVRTLNQALVKEQAVCSALHLELERERSAAATAADEAMAMILRLQEEKAAIEMQAKQYQRVLEEKSAYDAEEMDILKEILIRREREKHFLEKEVEAYRQMALEMESCAADIPDTAPVHVQGVSSVYSGEESFLMPQKIGRSVGKGATNVNESLKHDNTNPTCAGLHNVDLASVKELSLPENDAVVGTLNSHADSHHIPFSRNSDSTVQGFQERDALGLEGHVQVSPSTQGVDAFGETIVQDTGEEDECQKLPCLTSEATEAFDEAKVIFPYGDDNDANKQGINLHKITDDELCVDNKESGKVIDMNIAGVCNSPAYGQSGSQLDSERCSSDRSGGLPPTYPSQGKDLPMYSRRNSMSAFDYERSKIDNEVGWLRERLKSVQEEREKLKTIEGLKERKKVQMQILEGIASQLQEIRQLTQPGKSMQKALLPASSKVMSNKRQWRSASLGIQRSV